MKTKNKNRNPFFENEIQKRKLKTKNEILIGITIAIILIFMVSGSCLDADSHIPLIVCALCELWFVLFLFANWQIVKKIENRY